MDHNFKSIFSDTVNIDITQLVSDLLNPHIGFHIIDNFCPYNVAYLASNEAQYKYSHGHMDGGKIAKVDSENNMVKSAVVSSQIRNDLVTWIQNDLINHPFLSYIMESVDLVITHISNSEDKFLYFLSNNFLIINLHVRNGVNSKNTIPNVIKGRSRGMLSCYPRGSNGYLYHVDNPIKDGRLLTTIFYLNRNWVNGDGGELILYPGNNISRQKVAVEPSLNRLIVFWADERTPHEVIPSMKDRFALTSWYFDAYERKAYTTKCENVNNNK